MKERCLSLGLDGDFGYVAYAGNVFEFGFEWGFWVWLGFGVFLGFCLPSGLRLSTEIFESLSQCF